MNRNELLRSREYWLGKIQIELYNELLDYMQANELTQSDVAAKLGVSKGYMSQLLNGNFDHKLSKLVDLSLLMDKVPVVNYPQLTNYIAQENNGVMLPYKTFEYYSMKSPNELKDESLIKKPLTGYKEAEWFAEYKAQTNGSTNVISEQLPY